MNSSAGSASPSLCSHGYSPSNGSGPDLSQRPGGGPCRWRSNGYSARDRRAPARNRRRGLGVDHPVLDPELREERPEGGRRCERGGLSGEVELSRLEGLLQHLERLHREEEAALVGDPPSIGGERTAADTQCTSRC
jgi:hypothetical protein